MGQVAPGVFAAEGDLWTGMLDGELLRAAINDPANWTGNNNTQPAFPSSFTVTAPSGVGLPLSMGAALRGAVPNPFNPQTTIAFDLPNEGVVSLRVYDVGGRLINTLLSNEPASLGRNEVVWRGRDADGRVVPAGVYFYRLTAGPYSETKRMVLVK